MTKPMARAVDTAASTAIARKCGPRFAIDEQPCVPAGAPTGWAVTDLSGDGSGGQPVGHRLGHQLGDGLPDQRAASDSVALHDLPGIIVDLDVGRAVRPAALAGVEGAFGSTALPIGLALVRSLEPALAPRCYGGVVLGVPKLGQRVASLPGSLRLDAEPVCELLHNLG